MDCRPKNHSKYLMMDVFAIHDPSQRMHLFLQIFYKSFEYVYYDNDKCNYKVVKKAVKLSSIEMPEDLKVYLKLDTEQFLNIL